MASNEEYRDAVVICAAAGAALAQHDLPGMLAAIDEADAVGPVINPTLYREKADAMHQDAELLRAALPLWKLIHKRLPKVDR